MLEVLVVVGLLAIIFGAGYLIARDKSPPVTDTPVAEIEAELLLEDLAPVVAEPEQVKPKRTRKPRATTATKPKRPRKKKTEQ